MKAGRNEPCPCGSGKKYKHCCLRAAAVQEAWGAFTLAQEPFDPATPHLQAFMPWMFHR